MDKNKYTELTNTVYKLLDYFPEGEPLKNKAKEKALEIAENLALMDLKKEEAASQVFKDIEVLKTYLNLGKSQGWIESMNLLILLKEYDKMKEEIKPMVVLIKKEEGVLLVDNSVGNKEKTVDSKDLSSRQQEILKILKVQGKAQVSDLKRVMPNVSKRTLRRDLDDLLKRGKVARIGEWNQVFYKISQIEILEGLKSKIG